MNARFHLNGIVPKAVYFNDGGAHAIRRAFKAANATMSRLQLYLPLFAAMFGDVLNR